MDKSKYRVLHRRDVRSPLLPAPEVSIGLMAPRSAAFLGDTHDHITGITLPRKPWSRPQAEADAAFDAEVARLISQPKK